MLREMCEEIARCNDITTEEFEREIAGVIIAKLLLYYIRQRMWEM